MYVLIGHKDPEIKNKPVKIMENKHNANSNTTGLSHRQSRGLFWFRYDLRLHDHAALAAMTRLVDEITLVYILDESWFCPNAYGVQPMGEHRYQFLMESLSDLHTALTSVGHELLVISGNVAEVLVELLTENEFSHLGVSHYGGFNEVKEVGVIQQYFPALTMVSGHTCSLYTPSTLPFAVDDTPDVFSPFRRKIEKHGVNIPASDDITHWPVSFVPSLKKARTITLSAPPQLSDECTETFIGGESAALAHLHRYLFEWQCVSTYKETRNSLDNWRNSTKLSPWLAIGALSPKTVMRQLLAFEEKHVKNDSTYWVYFELLWREFFFWLQQKHGKKWFAYTGIHGKLPNTSHDPQAFLSWCNGSTGYPIVDACMRQLAKTGFLSNRGRQIVASCFVHELRQDWRYGAAWFEHKLIDFDVGSNWGNWLYLAGVGSDPRGHRQFNLLKQTEAYDPNGEFCNKWLL